MVKIIYNVVRSERGILLKYVKTVESLKSPVIIRLTPVHIRKIEIHIFDMRIEA
jgi:hypothetical protein